MNELHQVARGQSPWLIPLGLDTGLKLGPADLITEAPDWAAFLIWAGWWMRRKQQDNSRLVMALLLPERACCSALCCLGAILGSVDQGAQRLSWADFLRFPVGARVFLRLKDSKGISSAEAEIMGQECIEDQVVSSVRILGPARDTGVKLFIPPASFELYEFSLTPHMDTRERNRIQPVVDLLEHLHGSFDATWIDSDRTECLLLTNRARWHREVEGITVTTATTTADRPELQLEDLLFASTQSGPRARTLLCSPHSDLAGNETPVAILDGPVAFKSWEEIRCPNLLILLGQAEYDDSLEHIMRMLSGARTDGQFPPMEGPEALPPGIDMALLSLGKPTAT